MKRGNNIYHRADGRWEGRYYYKGTGKYKSVYGKTMTEAKEKLDKLRNEAFTPSRNCHYLVSDIMQMWLENRRTHIKESSFASYQNKIHKHILPYFSQLKYSALTAEILEKFIADKKAIGLSAKYVSDMVIVIKSVAKWAETAHNFLNQVRNVELPKAVKKETETFSSSEQKALFQTLTGSSEPTVTGIKLAVYTGVRIGELCALQWKDIDFERGVLKVTKTVQRISHLTDKRKSAVMITAPKSDTSVREIPLPVFVLDELRRIKGFDNAYIVSGSEKIIEPRCFTNRYKSVLKKAGVPSKKFHSLRHTFATNALQQGFDVKTLSEILGHSGANVTMKVYLHTSIERKTACMNLVKEIA
ncbi:MAG: site-specific integrase [Oscillospiraceae bacterium]|nr:site-specific integrase [Oscillospiraceae bacterium]